MAILTISRQLGSIDKEITQSMARLWKYEYHRSTKDPGRYERPRQSVGRIW